MDISEQIQCEALTKAYQVTQLLNYAYLPDNPEQYISEYQVELINHALGLNPETTVIASEKARYEKAYEFIAAIEGVKAALVFLQTKGFLL